MAYWFSYLRTWAKEQTGQDLVEYALLLFLIALAAITAIGLAGDAIDTIWNDVVTALGGAEEGAGGV